MDATNVQLILACCTTAHFTVASVLALYARHKVQYLSLAWIMGIFFFMLLGMTVFADMIAAYTPGVLNPIVLTLLVAISYLQSIYPLSFTLPGYLQWGRMWKYASPAIVLMVLYAALISYVRRVEYVGTMDQLIDHPFSLDLLLRVAALILSVWYIVNIFHLPRKVSHQVEVPRYLYAYTFILGLSALFYCYVSLDYSPQAFMLYLIIFTALNLYLCFRTLETMAINLPKPTIDTVKEEPTEEELRKAEEDFNEANLKRFNRLQYWMQNNQEEWTDNTFGREQLCRAVGLNRHLVLQSLRSQGFNNTRDYINSYRIDYLKRQILHHKIATITECLDAGFGTTKTVRTCFEKHEGRNLDEFLEAAKQRAQVGTEEE